MPVDDLVSASFSVCFRGEASARNLPGDDVATRVSAGQSDNKQCHRRKPPAISLPRRTARSVCAGIRQPLRTIDHPPRMGRRSKRSNGSMFSRNTAMFNPATRFRNSTSCPCRGVRFQDLATDPAAPTMPTGCYVPRSARPTSSSDTPDRGDVTTAWLPRRLVAGPPDARRNSRGRG